MTDTTDPDEKERAAAMDVEIIQLRRQRVPFDEIGRRMEEKYGRTPRGRGQGTPGTPFSKSYMQKRYVEALASIPAREAANHRAELGELLNEVIDAANTIMRKDHLAHSNGRVVELDGQPVLDDGPKLAAAGEIRKAAMELARLYGLNIPVKQEFGVNTQLDIKINGVDLGALK